MLENFPFDKKFGTNLVDLFNGLVNGAGIALLQIDIMEMDDKYVLEAEVPGISKEAIKIDYANNTLSICVNKEKSEEKANYILRERYYGVMKREFYLENIQADAIAAKYDNGLLVITLPKEKKETKVKIEIK